MAAKVWSMALIVLVAASLSLLVVVEGALQIPLAGSVSWFIIAMAFHFVCYNLTRYLHGLVCAYYAAVWVVADSSYFTDADPFWWHDPAREYAASD